MTDFDRDLVRTLLEICRYTYSAGVGDAENGPDREDAKRWLSLNTIPKPLGEPLSDPILIRGDKDPTSVACVVPYPSHNVVSYMGTKTEFRQKEFNLTAAKEIVESLHDWADNGKMEPVAFTLSRKDIGAGDVNDVTLEGRVHRGFLQQLRAVQGQIIAELLNRGGKQRPLIITGHSQGGAEAALATRAFAAAGFAVSVTYTFAAPRSGTGDYARSITSPVFRIEFGNDIVPHLPMIAIRKALEDVLSEHNLLAFISLPLRAALKSLKDFGYVGVGQLCYGSPEEPKLRVPLSAQQEDQLFALREKRLALRPQDWGDHHHLAGTTAETRQGLRGNYTALVSDFPIA